MKTIITTLALSLVTATSAFAADSHNYTLDVATANHGAIVTVFDNGQPVSGVDVTVRGNGVKHFVSGSKGTFYAANLFDNGRTFTFEIIDGDKTLAKEQRYLTAN